MRLNPLHSCLALIVAIASMACAPPENPNNFEGRERLALGSPDGFVTGPVDLHTMIAVVKVALPTHLKELFESAAVATDDPDLRAFFRAQARGGFGSGFVVVRRKAGKRYAFIITNRHVIEDAQDAEVGFSNGTTFAHCPVVFIHPTADLAVIALPEGAPFAFGFDVASATPHDRETVVATGYPALDGRPSFQTTEGKVSNAAYDETAADGHHSMLIQHTAAIDPGSSGGPLTNEAGKLVGINVAVVRGRQSVNFAVPARAMVEATDAAVDVTEHKTDAPYLRRLVAASCDRLAAELSSAHANGRATLDLIGMDLVSEQGPQSLTFAQSHTPPPLRALITDTFTRNPLDAYRVSLGFRVALRASLGGGVQPGAKCNEPNPTDVANITSLNRVRVMIPTARGAMEVAFGFDRGTYRIAGGDLIDLERVEQQERRDAANRASSTRTSARASK